MDRKEEKQTLVKASATLRSILREHFNRERKGPSPLRMMADRILEKEKAKTLRGDA